MRLFLSQARKEGEMIILHQSLSSSLYQDARLGGRSASAVWAVTNVFAFEASNTPAQLL